MSRNFIRANHSFSQLRGILSKMKVSSEHKFPESITSHGTSSSFSYATAKGQQDSANKSVPLRTNSLKIWNRLTDYEVKHAPMQVPLNGFEEMIMLTEQGRLWPYPIDNELGLDEEKSVPFEEHVFLEKHLEGFPKDDYIQSFMGFIISGLAKNPWLTVDRKVEAIKFYKDYFEAKKDTYKMAGLTLKE